MMENNNLAEELIEALKEELPHLKYSYECLLRDHLHIGPLKKIHDRLCALVSLIEKEKPIMGS